MAEMAGSLGDGSQVGLAGHHQVGIDNTRPDATQKPDCTGPCRILLLFGFIVEFQASSTPTSSKPIKHDRKP